MGNGYFFIYGDNVVFFVKRMLIFSLSELIFVNVFFFCKKLVILKKKCNFAGSIKQNLIFMKFNNKSNFITLAVLIKVESGIVCNVKIIK